MFARGFGKYPISIQVNILARNRSIDLTVGPTRCSTRCPTAFPRPPFRLLRLKMAHLKPGYHSCLLFTMCHSLSSGRIFNMW